MRRVVFLILIAVPLFAGNKDRTWTPGAVKVLNTDQWCGYMRDNCDQQFGAPPPLAVTHSGAPLPVDPTTQILEIDGSDAIYIVRRMGLDGGLWFRPQAVCPYAMDGKYLLLRVKRDSQILARRPPGHDTGWEQDRLKILEIRKKMNFFSKPLRISSYMFQAMTKAAPRAR